LVVFLTVVAFLSPVLAEERCYDPFTDKFVDRWFVLTEGRLRDSNGIRDQYGFLWMVANTRDAKLGTPQAMVSPEKQEIRREIEILFAEHFYGPKEKDNHAQFWFNDQGVSSSVPFNYYNDLNYKGLYINRAHSKVPERLSKAANHII
jgi:hypothetical protein